MLMYDKTDGRSSGARSDRAGAGDRVCTGDRGHEAKGEGDGSESPGAAIDCGQDSQRTARNPIRIETRRDCNSQTVIAVRLMRGHRHHNRGVMRNRRT
jgi:hypothetical protein